MTPLETVVKNSTNVTVHFHPTSSNRLERHLSYFASAMTIAAGLASLWMILN